MRISTWFSFFGVPSSPHPTTFPYKAKSPTLKKRITFTEEEVWREVDRALEENKDNQFTDGQVLFFNMVFCANPQYFFDPYLEPQYKGGEKERPDHFKQLSREIKLPITFLISFIPFFSQNLANSEIQSSLKYPSSLYSSL